MEYNFKFIEGKWQQYWKDNKIYKVENQSSKPKFYVLDMFPYPSGAGLHVGHPLGYIASDIYARYKRLQGFNVLHPMGYDAYGLPAEQYAIQTGQHPAITTEKNIARYREQLDRIGFSFDWSREIKTCTPDYYHWTQWAFVQMFNHWYNQKTQKAEPIAQLIAVFENEGNKNISASTPYAVVFTALQWKEMTQKQQQEILLNYRIAYLANTNVNWCPALGTVLANDEVKDGVSVRGGHPVVQRKMKQWSLRISAYAPRLLDGLETVDWSDSLKEIQRNWIGKSQGAEIDFKLKDNNVVMTVFTTRPDTIFGVSFMVLAPESELIDKIIPPINRDAVYDYIEESKKKTERERIADTKKTGVFTGAYCIHPFTGKLIPIWVSDYVLGGYGTGAIMAVPAHDQRDYDFAKTFNLPILQVIAGGDISQQAFDDKDGVVVNSDFLNDLKVADAINRMVLELETLGIGKKQINYKLRDAIFSRQRYWGEPFPVYYKDGMPYVLKESELPLCLPEIDKYLPTEKGEPPLGRAQNWKTEDGYPFELSTMPGFAGSSAYYLRYMDPSNKEALVSQEANEYWRNVDLYVGGTEHATGHLVYSRFWNKFLYDIGKVCEEEPFKKLINQGMIQGRSNFVYRVKNSNTFVSYNLIKDYDVTPIHVDVNIVENDVLDTEAFKNWMPDYKNAEFVLEGNKYVCGWAVEKMSKSMYNVVNPDLIVERFGADTLRLYEMFLGPVEQSKPWDTKGIDGVHRFLKKYWRLFYDRDTFNLSDEEPSKEELKTLHKTIKKISEDIERFSFNTSVSAFMICVNELADSNCNKRKVLEPLTILLSVFAPHITEEIWQLLGHQSTITDATFPTWNSEYLIEDTINYPVSINGKLRFKIDLPADMNIQAIEKSVLEHEMAIKWLEGNTLKKIIVVPGKIVNIVI